MADAPLRGWPRVLPNPRPVNISKPDLRPWLRGNCGIRGVWSFAASLPGPHVAVTAILHGNEIAGAIVLDRWLRAGLRPARGRLSLVFGNLDAFAHFDPADPTLTRFLEEDLNRVWGLDMLEGPRRSLELRRARELRPLIDTVDILVDMHSMSWPSDPLTVTGAPEKAARCAMQLGAPSLVVADEGHPDGRRLTDYARFADPATEPQAVLVEAGGHWEPETVAMVEQVGARALRLAGLAGPEAPLAPIRPAPAPRFARVTRTVVARTQRFGFVRDFRGGEVIPEGGTLIAMDGEEEIRTPHDDCLLVMPTPLAPRGYTAVRLARHED
ncbi:succinylglutamate desuccinylase/aspartoacylase family protein [Roseomonas sp. HF4]|uniref:succinylglutamate desuccinylase/aspartoacylase domain-containing protein n=1 Tax=Roseomonas sp. HF4 TaxID=2562313 RepID=UPI0010C07A36|nr:succinylglutamate desuccinylase/aspartoacylase family protein [Roseomonas sp. HF4]